jgi:phospholipid/cholesterol/gamma-HCH transport system ATP-binding protein
MVISFKDVKLSFEDNHLLRGISFSIQPSEKLAILGPGGCGKSTILKILLGLLPPDSGEVTLLGTDMRTASESEKQKTLRKVGMAFQQGALFDFMTVRENLLFAMEHMTEMEAPEMDETLKRLLLGVKLPHVEQMFPFELSGGMQRRVGIARALCTHPTVAIFDEPTAGLDPVTSTIILNMIGELAQSAATGAQLVVTSNVEIGVRFAKRIIVINEGKIVADGQWRELLLDADPWVRHFLGVRFIGLDLDYARGLDLPEKFIEKHWHG